VIRLTGLLVLWFVIGAGWGACGVKIIHLMQGGP
jgi:hypothetical protein